MTSQLIKFSGFIVFFSLLMLLDFNGFWRVGFFNFLSSVPLYEGFGGFESLGFFDFLFLSRSIGFGGFGLVDVFNFISSA